MSLHGQQFEMLFLTEQDGDVDDTAVGSSVGDKDGRDEGIIDSIGDGKRGKPYTSTSTNCNYVKVGYPTF